MTVWNATFRILEEQKQSAFPRHGDDAIRLVRRDPEFRCSCRTIELNTSLEGSWSTKLVSVGFSSHRGQLDELEQVIDSAARIVNQFL